MRKILNWIFKSKVDLKKRWWHRLFRVLFILSVIILVIYLVNLLTSFYYQVVHQWTYVESFSGRLSEEPYSGKVVSVDKLYGDNEVISEDKYPSQMNFSLESKEYLLPSSGIFLEGYESQNFCSYELYEHIKNISVTNNIKFFSTTNPTYATLSNDVGVFSNYLENNSYSIKCLMIDSYTVDNSKTTFLRPVDTSEYNIYEYKNNFSGFILGILWAIVAILLYMLFVVLIYYKVILYVVYGKEEKSSSK